MSRGCDCYLLVITSPYRHERIICLTTPGRRGRRYLIEGDTTFRYREMLGDGD